MTAIACNLAVFDDDERKRYQTLRYELVSLFEAIEEMPDGFSCRLPAKGRSLELASEFIALERRCCPFLELELSVKGDGPVTLRLKGNEPMKAMLRTELGRGSVTVSLPVDAP